MSNVVHIKDFEAQIRALGWTLTGAARFFGITDRTMRRWAADGEVARPVAMVLALMREHPEVADPRRLLELVGVRPRKADDIMARITDQRPWMQGPDAEDEAED